TRQRAQVALGMLTALPGVLRNSGNRRQKLIDILTARDVMFSWQDPGPALYQLVCYSYLFYRCWKHKMSLTTCLMDGVEWTGDAAAAAAMMAQAIDTSLSA